VRRREVGGRRSGSVRRAADTGVTCDGAVRGRGERGESRDICALRCERLARRIAGQWGQRPARARPPPRRRRPLRAVAWRSDAGAAARCAKRRDTRSRARSRQNG